MSFIPAIIWAILLVDVGSVSATFCSRYSSNNCNIGQSCCNNQCVDGYDCEGSFCSFDSDCSISEVCCSNTCSYSCDTVPIVIGAISGVVVFIGFIILIVCCCCRRRRPVGGYVVGNQQQQIIASTTTTNYSQPSQQPLANPYQGQQPYGYQQGYGQAPPQYGYGATAQRPAGYQQWQDGVNAPQHAGGPISQPPAYEAVTGGTISGTGGTISGTGNPNEKANYAEPSAPMPL